MKMLGDGNSEQQAQSAQAETPTPPRRQAPATPVEDIDDDITF